MDKRTEDTEMAITGLKGIATILEPLLLAANYEGLGKDDVKELRGHLNMAAKALGKQMPKKVVLYDLPTVDDIWLCPQCGSKMWGRHVSQTRFCAGCGQKLKWGEE